MGRHPFLQEVLWGGGIPGALWPFQPLGWDYLRPPHLHGQPELVIMRRGTMRLRLGAESYPLAPRQIALVPPSVEHVVEDLRPDTDFWILQFDPALLARAFELSSAASAPDQPNRRLTELFPDPPILEVASRDLDVVEQRAAIAWQNYLAAWSDDSAPAENESWIPPWRPAQTGRAISQLVDVLAATLDAVIAQGVPPERRRIARLAFDTMTGDPLLSRAELCRVLDVSEGHLSRAFPQVFGVSLVTQRARVRLSSFLSLATGPGSPNLLEACLGAGFGSYAQLSRVFSTLSPFSPRQYLHGNGRHQAAKIVRR